MFTTIEGAYLALILLWLFGFVFLLPATVPIGWRASAGLVLAGGGFK